MNARSVVIATCVAGLVLACPVAPLAAQGDGSAAVSLRVAALDEVVPSAVRVPMALSPGEAKHRSPALAWLLSYLLPGGGQAYNGQWDKAAVFLGVAVAGLAINASDDCGDYVCFGPGFWVAAASAVGSQIDAPVSAAAINRKAQRGNPRSASATVTVATIHF